MIKLSIRVDEYTKDLLIAMQKHFGYSSMNKLLKDLIQIGYLEMEKEYNGKN